MQVTFSLNDIQVRKTLTKMKDGVKDFSEPLQRSSEKLLPYFSETVFETQGSVLGESWRALAESTVRARARRSGYYARPPIATNKILIWTGRLKKSFRAYVVPNKLTINNPNPYFKYHQLSQRRMLAINPAVILTVMEEMDKYAKKLLT